MTTNYLETILKHHYRFFNATEKKIADYLLDNQQSIVTKTIAHVAEDTQVSQATIFKFVKKIGFPGFKDFKISVAANSASPVSNASLISYSDIKKGDSSYEIAMKLINSNIHSMHNLIPQIDQKKLDQALAMVYPSQMIHFFGTGGSSVLAYDSYQKFIRTKYRCDYIMDFHVQLINASKFTKDDVVFLFSHSGQSVETLKLAQAIADTEAKIIALTGNPQSSLAKLADVTITVYSEESKFRTESLASRILYLTIMDILYVNLMLHDETQSKKSMQKIRSILSVSKTDSNYIS